MQACPPSDVDVANTNDVDDQSGLVSTNLGRTALGKSDSD